MARITSCAISLLISMQKIDNFPQLPESYGKKLPRGYPYPDPNLKLGSIMFWKLPQPGIESYPNPNLLVTLNKT